MLQPSFETKQSKEKIVWKVREAIKTDAKVILEISEKTWLATYAGIRDTNGYIMDEAFFKSKFAKYSNEFKITRIENTIQDPTKKVLVNTIGNGQIVGFAFLKLLENNIWAWYIDPEFQGKGAGMALWNQIQIILNANTQKITLEIAAENYKAQAFYTKIGFVKDPNNLIPDFYMGKNSKSDQVWAPQFRMFRPPENQNDQIA